MDFGFAPGTSTYEGLLRRMLTARTSTTLVSKAGVSTFAGFLGELVTRAVTADALVPGSHASDEGFLFLALDPTTPVPINYETLEAVNTSGTIQIPSSIQGATVDVHFKGCKIGSADATPFMELLKKALGNPQSVTAPKFFHSLQEFNGIFEYMGYSYSVMNSTAFPDRTALIAAFVAEGFTEELDGTPVPDANFTTWIKPSLQLRPANSDKVRFNFPVTITPTTGGVSAIPFLKAECRSRAERFTYTLTVSGSIPASAADRLDLIENALSAESFMQTTHLYPVYQRMHFADFGSFFNGLTWKTSVSGSNLIGVGTHFVYTLMIPILKPGTTTSELLFNFYPATGAPLMNFLEDNAAFDMFGVV